MTLVVWSRNATHLYTAALLHFTDQIDVSIKQLPGAHVHPDSLSMLSWLLKNLFDRSRFLHAYYGTQGTEVIDIHYIFLLLSSDKVGCRERNKMAYIWPMGHQLDKSILQHGFGISSVSVKMSELELILCWLLSNSRDVVHVNPRNLRNFRVSVISVQCFIIFC